MSFNFKRMSIPDVVLVEPKAFTDERGLFSEIYQFSKFTDIGIRKPFIQTNYVRSNKGVLRGLHYQMVPKVQGKLIRILSGEVLDVAVDIRKGSPYYGKWVGEILSADNLRMLYIPEGFAHGFFVISDWADTIYHCTNEYAPELDRNIRWDDPAIGIEWRTEEPGLSPKDAAAPLLEEADNNFIYEVMCRGGIDACE